MNIKNEITMPALIDLFPDALEYLDKILEAADCPPKTQITLDIAFEEIYINIASYAYPDENADKRGNVTIIVTIKDDATACEVTFVDQGIPYNPLKKPDPDVTLSADERAIGGLGIYMVKQSMDHVEYRYENNSNIFTMYKKF